MATPNNTTPISSVPLVVDLDGTLHRQDLSWLLFQEPARRQPLMVPRFLLTWLLRGKAAAKEFCGELCRLPLDQLRWHDDVLAFLHQAKSDGITLVLATGTPHAWAEACNDHLGGIFERVVGSGAGINMIGQAKADALVASYGRQGFDYLGNSAQDLWVWPHCRHILLANAPASVARRARAIGRPVTHVFTGIWQDRP